MAADRSGKGHKAGGLSRAEGLAALTASEAAAEMARGAFSAEDYSRACLDRIDAVDGEVHELSGTFEGYERGSSILRFVALDGNFVRIPTKTVWSVRDVG